MNEAKKIIELSSKDNAYMSDFELSEHCAVDAHTSNHCSVKFYFKDSSYLQFKRKNGLWQKV